MGHAKVGWVTTRETCTVPIILNIVDVDVVGWLINVGCCSTVVILIWHGLLSEHLVPAAQILLPVKVLLQGRSLASAAYGKAGDKPSEPH